MIKKIAIGLVIACSGAFMISCGGEAKEEKKLEEALEVIELEGLQEQLEQSTKALKADVDSLEGNVDDLLEGL
jgi:outer membrane murein-binding lipoprotein Lpp